MLPFERYTAKEGIARIIGAPRRRRGSRPWRPSGGGAEGPERGAGLVLVQQERRAIEAHEGVRELLEMQPVLLRRRRAAATARAGRRVQAQPE